MTRPTWQKTSLARPRSHCAPNPPTTASGTPSRMMKGRTQLSYWAASTRYTSIRLSANMKSACAPAWISSSDWAAQAKSYPGGRFSRETRSMACRAWPELAPGAAAPLISAERNRLKWLMTWGAVTSCARTTLVEGHHGAVVGARVELAEVLGVGAELLVGLHVHAVGPVVEVEVVHVGRAQEHLERVRDLAQRQAQAARLVAVDVHHQLRVVRPERREEADHLPGLSRLGLQGGDRVGQARHVAARLVEQLVLESAEDRQALDARRREGDHEGARYAHHRTRGRG